MHTSPSAGKINPEREKLCAQTWQSKAIIKKRALVFSRLYCNALLGALLCLFFQVDKSFEINH
jgi:hypothetical protein